MAEILPLPVIENKRQQYWNSTCGLQRGQVRRFGAMSSIIPPGFVDMYPSRPMLLAFSKKIYGK